MPDTSKTDEFSEKFQTAFDPPPHFRKIILQFFSKIHDRSIGTFPKIHPLQGHQLFINDASVYFRCPQSAIWDYGNFEEYRLSAIFFMCINKSDKSLPGNNSLDNCITESLERTSGHSFTSLTQFQWGQYGPKIEMSQFRKREAYWAI